MPNANSALAHHALQQLPYDFAEAYRQYMQSIDFSVKPAEEWDRRAAALNFSHKNSDDTYVNKFISQMTLDKTMTVLDVGCGPGTLAVKLAPLVKHVYCLDYSQNMLALLHDNLTTQGSDNFTTIHLSKEDDWSTQVPICDVVISSRSGLDADLAKLFKKLASHATKSVHYSHLVGGYFEPAVISHLLGKPKPPFADYIYAVNILYQLGYMAKLDFVQIKGRFRHCKDFDSFFQLISKKNQNLSQQDMQKLQDYFDDHHHLFDKSPFDMTWALISFDVHH